MVVPHVPKRGTDILRHADAIACICRRGDWQHRRLFPVLRFHLSVGLEAAACEADPTPRLHRDASSALIAKTDTEHLAIAGRDEALRHEGAAHLDVALCDIVLQDLHHAPAIAGSAAAKMRVQGLGVVEAWDFDDVGVVEGVVAGEWIVPAVVADAHLCAIHLRKIADFLLYLGHTVRKHADNIVRRPFGVSGLQIRECVVDIAGATHRAVGANRDAARHRLLFCKQHPAARISRVDRAECACKPETDNDDIERLVEVGYAAVWQSVSDHPPNSSYGNRNAAGSTVVMPTACSPAIAIIASSSS